MKEIYILKDYRNIFGSKYNAKPYRSGYDLNILKKYFTEKGYSVEYLNFYDVSFQNDNWKRKVVLYTSNEDSNLIYKQYIEDIILGLELNGAIVIPGYKYLRANNNKIFMEILRDSYFPQNSSIKSMHFGTFEEFSKKIITSDLKYPCVIKSSEGAMSKGVFLANNLKELKKIAKKISATNSRPWDIKDTLRKYKHKGYLPESKHKGKFIIQNLIPDLKFDWKVLIYGDDYYVLRRGVRKNDFRASGSGINYFSGSKSEIPVAAFDLLDNLIKKLDLPNISVDLAFDGSNWHIFEIQTLYYGTSTILRSKDYYSRKQSMWLPIPANIDLEAIFAKSYTDYLEKHPEFFE